MKFLGCSIALVAILPCFLTPPAAAEAPPAASPGDRGEGQAGDAIDVEIVTATSGGAAAGELSAARSACPSDMVEVEGDYCPVLEQYCLRPVDVKHPEKDRCAEFAETGRCYGRTQRKHFCIDKYEWPNREGEKPVVAVDWMEARDECTAVGKRLCMDNEWTLACEGQERLPYPYGYARNPDACNIDRPYIVPDEHRFLDPRTRDDELRRLDQRDPSGAREACVSPYGVYDMTGNVDEWVLNDSGKTMEAPYFSGLKGGYWGPVRDRCRPMTTAHSEQHIGYQIGFRCCGDLPDTTGVAARTRSQKDAARGHVASARAAVSP